MHIRKKGKRDERGREGKIGKRGICICICSDAISIWYNAYALNPLPICNGTDARVKRVNLT